MARKTDAELKLRRESRAARLAAPVAPADPSAPPQAGTVSAEQRLKDLQAQRLETMQQLADYKKNHRIEFFKPHLKQARFIRAALDQGHTTLSFVAGNRVGKTEVVAVLTVAFALGRLPWVPLPKPFTFPNPLAVAVLDADALITHTAATIDRARQAWDAIHTDPAQAYDKQGNPVPDPEHPHSPPPFPGQWSHPKRPDGSIDDERLVGRFPAAGGSRQPGTYENLKATLQIPKDPAKLRFKTPIKIRMFGEKTDTLSEVQVPKLQRYIPPPELALSKKGQTGVIEHFLFRNGSSIDLLTYQQEPSSMEGWDGHIAVFDEPPPRPVYIANVRGLVDHQGIALFSMTPLKEPWISDEIVNNPDPSHFSITASSYDNPHVDRSALDAFFAKLNDDELETRRDGKFLHLQGLVFKEFDKQTHVVRPFKPDRSYTVYAAIDNHPRTEQAVLFVAVDKHDRVFAFKEIFQHGTPEDIVRWVVDVHDNVHSIRQVLIDRSSQADTNRGASTYEIIEAGLCQAGIPLDFGSKDLSSGIQIVRDYLRSQNGIASAFITDDCPRLIWELLRYRWAEWRGGTDKSNRTPLNKPVDADDHLIENFRRLLQLPAQWVEPQTTAIETPWAPADPIAGY